LIAIAVSLVAGGLGALLTRVAADRLAAGHPDLDVHAPWALGVAALAPAWLVVLVSLLPSAPGVRPQLVAGAAWITSASAALVGAIASEGRLRAAAGDGALPARRCWRRGLVVLAPAWAIAVLGRLAG
jgi:hypothetical protein